MLNNVFVCLHFYNILLMSKIIKIAEAWDRCSCRGVDVVCIEVVLMFFFNYLIQFFFLAFTNTLAAENVYRAHMGFIIYETKCFFGG